MNDPLQHRLLLTTEQAAKRLGVARTYVENLIDKSELGVVFIRGHKRVPVAQLERWIEKNTMLIKN